MADKPDFNLEQFKPIIDGIHEWNHFQRQNYAPWYDPRSDYNTNAKSYYDYLARHNWNDHILIDTINKLLRREIKFNDTDTVDFTTNGNWETVDTIIVSAAVKIANLISGDDDNMLGPGSDGKLKVSYRLKVASGSTAYLSVTNPSGKNPTTQTISIDLSTIIDRLNDLQNQINNLNDRVKGLESATYNHTLPNLIKAELMSGFTADDSSNFSAGIRWGWGDDKHTFVFWQPTLNWTKQANKPNNGNVRIWRIKKSDIIAAWGKAPGSTWFYSGWKFWDLGRGVRVQANLHLNNDDATYLYFELIDMDASPYEVAVNGEYYEGVIPTQNLIIK